MIVTTASRHPCDIQRTHLLVSNCHQLDAIIIARSSKLFPTRAEGNCSNRERESGRYMLKIQRWQLVGLRAAHFIRDTCTIMNGGAKGMYGTRWDKVDRP